MGFLAGAGWIPWDMADYRPPIGAIMMHGAGTTPGHTYISAGDDGRLIVDNGAPQGRDLRATKANKDRFEQQRAQLAAGAAPLEAPDLALLDEIAQRVLWLAVCGLPQIRFTILMRSAPNVM